ncbi:rhomboid-like protein [Streptomyces sp. NPDC020802]|uniref:rhomboid-like protein n=1 Tax=Streptomyces sp. NPDC020802 TaxID=3365094 RepID=UPI00379306BC
MERSATGASSEADAGDDGASGPGDRTPAGPDDTGTPGRDDTGTPGPDGAVVRGLDAVPRQRGVVGGGASAAGRGPCRAVRGSRATEGKPGTGPRRRRAWPPRLLPGPTTTPFTFGYAVVLALTSLFTEYADAGLVDRVLQGSSTDVAHLAQSPVHVLVASALWVAGGITSVYVIAFLLVLTALERRIGGWRTAGVFLMGHAVATLATEVPVGLAVLVGHLPESSLHRYDYGISFGVAASVGALAGLLPPLPRWTLLAVSGWMVADDLIAFTDPLTNWGHLMALALGVAAWPLVRRSRGPAAPASPTPS